MSQYKNESIQPIYVFFLFITFSIIAPSVKSIFDEHLSILIPQPPEEEEALAFCGEEDECQGVEVLVFVHEPLDQVDADEGDVGRGRIDSQGKGLVQHLDLVAGDVGTGSTDSKAKGLVQHLDLVAGDEGGGSKVTDNQGKGLVQHLDLEGGRDDRRGSKGSEHR